MIIQCSSCQKKFNVPDGAITPAGRIVQCSSCGNQWTQYPVKKKTSFAPQVSAKSAKAPVKKAVKKKGPTPYSKEYMQQKWGSSVQSYAKNEGLSKKTKKITEKVKRKKIKDIEKPGFGFFNYLIMFFVFSTFFVGVLNFEKTRLSRKFPFLEPYIEHFFESLEIIKIFIFDFFR
tara:strand:+ start:87 stop:611 length:525 start_codon:yes stop_codon:yes gene_type:complete